MTALNMRPTVSAVRVCVTDSQNQLTDIHGDDTHQGDGTFETKRNVYQSQRDVHAMVNNLPPPWKTVFLGLGFGSGCSRGFPSEVIFRGERVVHDSLTRWRIHGRGGAIVRPPPSPLSSDHEFLDNFALFCKLRFSIKQ